MRFRGLFVFPIVLSLFSLPSSADVLKVVIDDTIQAATAERVERAIDRASEQKYEAVLLEVDTPGGLMDSMENIMVNLLANEFPSLGGGSLALPGVFLGTFKGVFFRHWDLLIGSPPSESSARREPNQSGKGCKRCKSRGLSGK